ncbi:hypothetical protein HK102_006780 [Quaeritorhiza haematococci]|nr:hypothetical protein HK102_006780 [Quaeritorhiza haematococci]
MSVFHVPIHSLMKATVNLARLNLRLSSFRITGIPMKTRGDAKVNLEMVFLYHSGEKRGADNGKRLYDDKFLEDRICTLQWESKRSLKADAIPTKVQHKVTVLDVAQSPTIAFMRPLLSGSVFVFTTISSEKSKTSSALTHAMRTHNGEVHIHCLDVTKSVALDVPVNQSSNVPVRLIDFKRLIRSATVDTPPDAKDGIAWTPTQALNIGTTNSGWYKLPDSLSQQQFSSDRKIYVHPEIVKGTDLFPITLESTVLFNSRWDAVQRLLEVFRNTITNDEEGEGPVEKEIADKIKEKGAISNTVKRGVDLHDPPSIKIRSSRAALVTCRKDVSIADRPANAPRFDIILPAKNDPTSQNSESRTPPWSHCIPVKVSVTFSRSNTPRSTTTTGCMGSTGPV